MWMNWISCNDKKKLNVTWQYLKIKGFFPVGLWERDTSDEENVTQKYHMWSDDDDGHDDNIFG